MRPDSTPGLTSFSNRLDYAKVYFQNALFQIGDDLGSDHLPIEISVDATPHRNSYTNHTKYKFDQTDREVFESKLEAALGSENFSGLTYTNDLDNYADCIVTAISNAVDRAISKSKSVRSESNPISDETLVLIKEKHRLRRQYSQIKDLRVETQASWKKFCSSVSLESDLSESWCKIKNFLKPKGQCNYTIQHCATMTKSPRHANKAQLFAESVERHLGIESKHFDSNHVDKSIS